MDMSALLGLFDKAKIAATAVRESIKGKMGMKGSSGEEGVEMPDHPLRECLATDPTDLWDTLMDSHLSPESRAERIIKSEYWKVTPFRDSLSGRPLVTPFRDSFSGRPLITP
jgi:hypothetical protein